MKFYRLCLLACLLLLTACFGRPSSASYLSLDPTSEQTYTYTVEGYQKTYTLKIPSIHDQDSILPLVYSLNPLVENKEGRALEGRLFFARDEISSDLKNQIYSLGLYGYGFWELNPVGLSKTLDDQSLNESDYVVFHGDYYHTTDADQKKAFRYYLATQELIWESIPNPDTNKNFAVEFKDIDLSKEKQEILDLLVKKKIHPYFSGNILTVNHEDIEKQTVFTYEDENNVLPGFEVIPSDGIDIVEVSDNRLSFMVTQALDHMKITFQDRYKLKQEETRIYSSQDNISYLVIGSDQKDRTLSTLDIELAAFQKDMVLKIPTHDKNTLAILAGAKYQVSLNQDFSEYRQSEAGTLNQPASISGLVPGTYYIRQVQAPSGYQLNETIQRIKIAGGISAIEFGFTNEKLPD